MKRRNYGCCCCLLSCAPEGIHGLAIESVGVFVKIADAMW